MATIFHWVYINIFELSTKSTYPAFVNYSTAQEESGSEIDTLRNIPKHIM